MISVRKYYLLAAVIVFTVLCFACSAKPTAPSEIIGIWKTGDEASAGVSIEFTPKKIIISSDLGVIENTITKIESQQGQASNTTLYSVYYSDRNKETNLMNVFYSPEDGGILKFKSQQDMIWKRFK